MAQFTPWILALCALCGILMAPYSVPPELQRTFQSAGVNRGGITPRTGPGASKAGPRPGGGAARRR